jgi:hypothetical protein
MPPNEQISYFCVKTFKIFQVENGQLIEYIVDDEIKEFIKSQKYMIDSIHSRHYDPDIFFKYIKFLSKKNPTRKYRVFYKYKYYNHYMNDEYQNELEVINSVINDNLIR